MALGSFNPHLSQIWWVFLLKGLTGLILGFMLLTEPAATLVALTTLLGFYWLVLGVLSLVLLATVLSVMFATRAAMATNRPVIEVLHLIGAKDSFIAAHFEQHFLQLGLKGGLLGGGAAIVLFVFAELSTRWFPDTAGGDQLAAVFGTFSIGALGYLAVLVQIGLVAGVTAVTSRHTVKRTIDTIE